MKKTLIILLTIALSATIFGQYSKPIIDTGMLNKWPSIDFYGSNPIISQDGEYLAYVINNQPFNSNTLVIQATRTFWKKEAIAHNIEDYFFCFDNKKLFWKNADTLFSLVLGKDKVEYITNIASFNVPKLKKGLWIAYQLHQAPSELVVVNLISRKEFRFDAVMEYLFNDLGSALLAKTNPKESKSVGTSLQWINPQNGKALNIWTASNSEVIDNYTFDKEGDQIAFIVQDKSGSLYSNSIWYYKAEMSKAVLKVNKQSPHLISDSLVITSAAQFSGNGKWLFFELNRPEVKRDAKPDGIQVDIWTYKDKELYPQQSFYADRRQGVVDVNNSMFIYVSQKDELLASLPGTITGDYIVICDRDNSSVMWWPYEPQPSYWLIALKDGTRTLLKKGSKYPVWGFSFSPGGRWLLYWDSKEAGYISYNLQQGKTFKICQSMPPVDKEMRNRNGFSNSIYSQPEDEVAGWFEGDEAVLIYDQYDIWKVDPVGRQVPINITNGYGLKHHIKLRQVYGKESESNFPIIYSGKESLLLTGFNTINKYNGFFIKNLNEQGDPVLLTMGPYTYYRTSSQRPGGSYSFGEGLLPVRSSDISKRCWIIQRMSASEYPNYFFTEDFKNFKQLSHLQPHKDYNWLTAELVHWKQLDGTICQGILYKPENFDTKKKYPVIFNYYEMLSHRLYSFPYPFLTDGNIDISWFVSRGYLVFTPDIHFSIASQKGGKTTGEAAYNSIESAAIYLSKLPFVNSKKMAIQGHSFGGGITNYLIAQSKLFVAACSAASTASNEISAYLGLARAKGELPRQFRMTHAETSHDRIGVTLWQRPDLYIKASPVFKANQVTTPLLLMHNQGDGVTDWGQSAELYMALRRLGKKTWMLQYDNEGHTLQGRKNAIDFTIRLTQFFDHYLKDAPAPKWMTQNTLAKYKGNENLYDFDVNGNCGTDCSVCKKISATQKKGQ